MNSNKKIFILLPDGIGLRNFAYSKFHETAQNMGFNLVFWNNTPFDIQSLGFKEIKIQKAKTHPTTDILKNARKTIEIDLNVKKFNDNVYNSYKFPQSFKSIKSSLKNILTNILINCFSSDKGLKKIRNWIKNSEQKTDYFNECLATLQEEKPEIVFCTNQRPMLAIAPILAAQKLKIPTATFIFSWDNLPKATMVIETDYYFVWSDLMKNELIKYYPYVNDNQVFITGTTQFESHYEKRILVSKETFFKDHNLDLQKDYICFSGDDETTSPDDPQYLYDLAIAIKNLNTKGYNLGIIFRKCPVDFSGRYNNVVEKFNDIIIEIDPLWKSIGTEWNTILPTKADNELLANTINHTLFVANLGSSMVFDYITFNKPCCYFNYNQKVQLNPNWDIHTCYKYVHFRSMPSQDSVVWLNSSSEIETKIEQLLNSKNSIVTDAKKWFKIINQHPPEKASERICEAINTILN